MIKLTKKDFLKEITKQTNLRKKIAKEVTDVFVLGMRDSIAEGGYKIIRFGVLRTSRTARKTKKIGIPIIEENKDYMIGTISRGTKLNRRKARRAIRIMSDKIVEATKKNDIVEVEAVGRFINEARGRVRLELTFEPFEPEKIVFPECTSSKDLDNSNRLSKLRSRIASYI